MREILNGESAEVQGIEIEGLNEPGFLGGFFSTLFLQGKVTFQDSELRAGPRADAPTNPVRPLSGASEYVANVMLGFDSFPMFFVANSEGYPGSLSGDTTYGSR